jgi:hypothetical protein
MRLVLSVLALSAAFGAVDASAQGVNLTGRYRCVQFCSLGDPSPAFVTQNGWELNVVNENGNASRAWVDWPGHIWVNNWNEGAIFSPDGMTIQFDRGTVWQREVEPPPAPVVVIRRRR